MKLLVVIPALNEESSIGNVIERSLAARKGIIASSAITEVSVTVVSDGSTDRTVEIARQYVPDIELIVFKNNRGYGAAIQQAWDGSDAGLLGFLDADGTCDPEFFCQLVAVLLREKADIALGSRLNSASKMPLLRQTGNVFFAGLLTLLSGTRIRDTASGMRVLRREAYNKLRPLPDGLHFTPAMTARALLDRQAGLKLVEADMPYRERIGESKLRVGKDGLRFLNVITSTALTYRPTRMAAILAAAGTAAGTIISVASRRPR